MVIGLKKAFMKYEIAGFIFVSVLGTLSHFIYEWSGCNTAVGLFCPVNESVWEHLKLIFFPYFIWSVIEMNIMKGEKGILPSKLIGVLTGMTFIVSFYYTYSGVIGKEIEFLSILSFFIGVAAAFLIDFLIIKSECLNSFFWLCVAVAGFLIISGIFIAFTVAPPLIPLFKDPKNLSYGI